MQQHTNKINLKELGETWDMFLENGGYCLFVAWTDRQRKEVQVASQIVSIPAQYVVYYLEDMKHEILKSQIGVHKK